MEAARLEMVEKEGDQLKGQGLEGGGTGKHTLEKMKNSSPSRTEAKGQVSRHLGWEGEARVTFLIEVEITRVHQELGPRTVRGRV